MRGGPCTYELVVTENFDREFSKLRGSAVQRRIWRKVTALKDDPTAGVPLASVEDPVFGRLHRIRVGDYRVVYAVRHDKQQVVLLRVRHRKHVYRGL